MNSSLAFMNLGGQEMIIIFVIVLLLFGAKKIPELARGLGKSMGEFKKAREEFEREIQRSEDEATKPAVKDRKPSKDADYADTDHKSEDEIRIKEVAGREPREV